MCKLQNFKNVFLDLSVALNMLYCNDYFSNSVDNLSWNKGR